MASTRRSRWTEAVKLATFLAWWLTLVLEVPPVLRFALAAVAILCMVVFTRWREVLPQRSRWFTTQQPWQTGVSQILLIVLLTATHTHAQSRVVDWIVIAGCLGVFAVGLWPKPKTAVQSIAHTPLG